MIPRFSLFIEAVKRGLVVGADRRRLLGPLGKLAPLAGLLWHYLGHTRRRLAALHARYAAGRLSAAPRRRATPRPADRPRPERRAPGIPRGPVLLQFGLACFIAPLRELVDDPETRALLAASPQAGRLLRPLWRKLTADPLPEVLRLPPKPKRARVARPESPAANPSPRPLVCSSQPKPARGEGEVPRPASRYPVSLWPDPAPAAEPPVSPPPWPPPLFQT